MSTKDEIAVFKATETGFFGGGRVKPGETFRAPAGSTFKWAKKVGAKEDEPVAEPLTGVAAFLDRSAKDIIDDLKKLTDAELREALSAEQSGKARKGVMAAISDELTNRLGTVKNDELLN